MTRRPRPGGSGARRAVRRAVSALPPSLALCCIGVAFAAGAPVPSGPNRAGASARAAQPGEFQRQLDAGLALYHARRFAEAREAFLGALRVLPDEAGRANLEFDIAACEYELGRFAEAQRRFERVAELDPSVRGEARLSAGWAALAAGDTAAAQARLDAVADAVPEPRRSELAAAIESTRREQAAAELDKALARATAAYEAGDLSAADSALRAARERAAAAPKRTQATLEYLTALVAHERGDDELTRQALARCLEHDPKDGAAHALLGELSRRDGDAGDAERHYRASLAADIAPTDAALVRQALDSLHGLPPRGLDVWATLSAGYDSNATQSGSTETLGYAIPEGVGSPFGAPSWGLEYRMASSSSSRVGVYYAGDWLVLGNPDVEDFSLQSHEAGLRFYLGLSRALNLRLVAAGGATLSGLELSPFSLDSLLGARLSLRHGVGFESLLSVEVRPSRGLSGQDYLSGVRSEVSLAERFSSGRWAAALSAGYRHVAIGTELVDLDPARFPRCNFACSDARYRIPLGYAGPVFGAGLELSLSEAISIGVNARYEHRTYLEPSRIEGPVLPELLGELSEKTRSDDRYTLGSRARYELGAAPAVGLFLDYTLRLSRSNVAFQLGDIEHAFDYDDRNFIQHLVELGADLRL